MSKSRRGWKRWVTRGLVLLSAVGGLALVFRDRLEPEEPAPPQTVRVERGDVEQTVLATGELEAVRLVSVGAQATGRIVAVHVEIGDTVRKGDPIAEIDSMTQQNALRNAEASLANIRAQKRLEQANLKQAEAAYERQKRLLEKGASAAEEFEAAEAALEVTRAQIDAIDAQITKAEIEVDTANVNLGYTQIVAPMDGVVVAVMVEEGQTVNAVQAAPTMIKLADLDTMTVSAEVSEADVTRVEVGQPVYFTILGEPDRDYHSKLRRVEPAPESLQAESTTTASSSEDAIYYNAIFDVPNPEHQLRIAMTAEVSIVLARAEDVLLVPVAAVDEGPRGDAVVRVLTPEQTIEIRPVTTGISDGIHTEIRSGLREGEQVVTSMSPPAGVSAPASGRRGMGPPPMF